MQIHQQRAERESLVRLLSGTKYGPAGNAAEKVAFLGLWRTARSHPANSSISAGSVRLITSGWAGWLRYGTDGAQQIFLFLMPGDFIIPGLFEPGICDLVCLTPLRTVDASPLLDVDEGDASTASIIRQSGRYYRLLLVDHLTRLTAGSTTRSVAHLLFELYTRSADNGACEAGRFSMPIGQRVLGRALGRSTVQVNKVMTKLQTEGLVRVGYDWVEMLDAEALRARAAMPSVEPGKLTSLAMLA